MPERGQMDANTLMQAMPGLDPTIANEYVGPFNQAMREANITTPQRAAMFCAQVGHESVSLRYMREIADGSAYEGRRDLGNTQPGDGRKFRGRGIIQVTGRANTTTFSRWAHARGLVASPDALAHDPTPMERLPLSMLTASWYWTQARPQLNALSDAGDMEGATRAINGGLNGIADRRARYQRCLALGGALLPEGGTMTQIEKRLDYPRDEVHQDTGWNCGPASAQTVIRAAAKKFIPESVLAAEMGTHRGGTDHIGQITRVLGKYLPDAEYRTVEMPNDPPTSAQRDRLWQHLTGSIDAGYGMVVNIVAPPNNYPRPSYTSTQALQYSGGTVYHYVAAMGYAIDGNGVKHVWIADSGFAPYGSWVTFSQFATLIPPKGYAYATAQAPKAEEPKPENPGGGEQMENNGLIQSLVNPSKHFTRDHLLAINDRTLWETHVMVKELMRRAGVDPDEFVAKAIEEDNRK